LDKLVEPVIDINPWNPGNIQSPASLQFFT